MTCMVSFFGQLSQLMLVSGSAETEQLMQCCILWSCVIVLVFVLC